MSGVAEGIAGLTLSTVSIAALFTTCIDCFNIVAAAKDFGHDYELLCTALAIQKLRLLLWGESVGLASRNGRQSHSYAETLILTLYQLVQLTIILASDGPMSNVPS